MNFLDMKTVYFTMLATDIVCTLVLVQLWRQSRERFVGTGLWVIDFAFQTVALLLILLRGIVPDWMSMVLSNTMVLTAALLGLIGLERFTGEERPQTHNYVLLCAFVPCHSYFAFAQPDLRLRNICIATVLLIMCFQCLWLMLVRVPPHRRPLTRDVGLVFGAFCLVNFVRISGLLAAPDPGQDYFHSNTLETIVPVLYQLLLILLTYSLSLMVNKRLLLHIKNEEEKFSSVFHFSPYAITLTRLSDGKIIEVNEAFVNTTGYSHAEALGETTVDLHIWQSKENRDALIGELARHGSARNVEEQFRTRTGEMRTGLVSAEIITINNEKSILSNIVDITERKRSEEERNRLIIELREAFANIKTLEWFDPHLCLVQKNTGRQRLLEPTGIISSQTLGREFFSRNLPGMRKEDIRRDAREKVAGIPHRNSRPTLRERVRTSRPAR